MFFYCFWWLCRYADFITSLRLYDQCPTLPDFMIDPAAVYRESAATLLKTQDPDFFCAFLECVVGALVGW